MQIFGGLLASLASSERHFIQFFQKEQKESHEKQHGTAKEGKSFSVTNGRQDKTVWGRRARSLLLAA